MVSETAPVPEFLAVTFAAGTAAFPGSVTVPVMAPRSPCANMAAAHKTEDVTSRICMDVLLKFWGQSYASRQRFCTRLGLFRHKSQLKYRFPAAKRAA